MDDSMSFVSKPLSPKAKTTFADDDSPEESGWSIYFEDFMANNNDEVQDISSFSSCYETSSMVSYAAFSSAGKKCFAAHDKNKVQGFPSDRNNTFKKLSFKKRRKGALVDDDLEDTASSPVNSPKVSCMNQYGMSMKNRDITDILDQEKRSVPLEIDEKREVDFVGGDDNTHTTELKKKGLCLVPLSTLMNYLG